MATPVGRDPRHAGARHYECTGRSPARGENFTYTIARPIRPELWRHGLPPPRHQFNDRSHQRHPATAGTSAIALTATNAAASGTANLSLTVNPVAPVNTAPTVSAIANQVTTVNTAAGPLAFLVGDAQSAAGSLTVSATSSNQTLVPGANLSVGAAARIAR